MRITPRPWPPPPPPKNVPLKYPEHFVHKSTLPYDFDLWARVQERDNEWLSSQSWIVGWETNPPSVHFDREETIVWINDKKYVDVVPKQLFGLPTTVILSEDVYDGAPYRATKHTTQTLLKRNFDSRWAKLMYTIRAYIKKLI